MLMTTKTALRPAVACRRPSPSLPKRCALVVSALGSAAPLAAAEPGIQVYVQPANLPWRIAGIVLALVAIWIVLYKAVYPFFLRYYRADYCKTVFWNLFLLYSFTWVFLSAYLLLEVGFYWAWMPWFAALLGVLWLISGLVLLLQRRLA